MKKISFTFFWALLLSSAPALAQVNHLTPTADTTNSSVILGDANGDGVVDRNDLILIVQHILGYTADGFSTNAADANLDGMVNVADYTAVAHLLNNGTAPAPTEAVTQTGNTIYIAPLAAFANDVLTLSVKMKNIMDVEGFQFTLILPEGMSIVHDANGFADASLSTVRTTKNRTNTFGNSLQSDGSLKVLAASSKGSTISEGDDEVCTIKVRVASNLANGNYTIQLKDIAICDANARSYNVTLEKTTITIGAYTGISDNIRDTETNNSYYDLQGRRLNGIPSKSMFILNGKKYIK